MLDMSELQSLNSEEGRMLSSKELYNFLANQKKSSWGDKYGKYFKDVINK